MTKTTGKNQEKKINDMPISKKKETNKSKAKAETTAKTKPETKPKVKTEIKPEVKIDALPIEEPKKKEIEVVLADEKKPEDKKDELGFDRTTRLSSTRTEKSVKELHELWMKGKLNFTLAIQRGEVWTLEQKTNLIYSVLYGYHIPSAVAEMQNGDDNIYFLDGKQRITTILKFINGERALGKDMPKVYGYDFAKMKFKDLPEKAQEYILFNMVSVVLMFNMTEEERDIQFTMLNMGSELKPIEKTRAMYSGLIEDVNELSTHTFLVDSITLSSKARTRYVDQEMLFQMMILETDGVEGFKGFSSTAIKNYVLKMKEKGETISDKLRESITKQLDYLELSTNGFSLEESKRILKKVNVPIIYYTSKKAQESDLKPILFEKFLLEFFGKKYSVDSEYGQLNQKGSASKENISRRIEIMNKELEKFSKMEHEAQMDLESI